MIQIKKFENIYGITKVIGADELEKINVIYAPNGTAKTSISDGLECIGNMCELDKIKDVMNNSNEPSFEIDVDNTTCNEKNRCKFNVIKYNGIDEFELKNLESLSNLVISNVIKESIKDDFNNIQSLIKSIREIIENKFETKKNAKSFFSKFAIFESCSQDEFTLFLKMIKRIDATSKPLPIELNEDIVIDLADDKLVQLTSKDSFQQKIKEYSEINQRIKLDKNKPDFFDEEFTLESLIALHK